MRSILSFIKSIDFHKSVTLLVAVIIPLGILSLSGLTQLAVSVIMGIFLCSPSDVPGSSRHMSIGILVSSVLATLTTVVVHFALMSEWVLIPVLSILVMFHSMLSVYGFRASLVSFSGLLAIILSFAHPIAGAELWLHSGLIFAGGMWYLLVTRAAHKLMATRHNLLILSESMSLTATYLKTRSELVNQPNDEKLQNKLFELQTSINEKHDKLREIFVASRTRSGRSNFASKYILIFIELVDILELTVAIPKVSEIKGTSAFSTHFEELLKATGRKLEYLSREITGDTTGLEKENVARYYYRTADSIEDFLRTNELSHTHQEVLMLRNLLDYVGRQHGKLESIERVLQGLEDQRNLSNRGKEIHKFINQVDYDPSLFFQNLSAGSVIFKHSVRLTITVLVAYAIGSLLHLQNAYWIILTVIVIMRPSYGLTKSRSTQRVIGTLIGGAIALGIVLLTQNEIVYGILAALSLIFAFSLIQRNYRGSAIFITLNIVFLYSLMHPNPLEVIKFRIFDTVIGAALAYLASLFIWPHWEYSTIRSLIIESIKSNKAYINEISQLYEHKGDTPIIYKLARKEAFLAFGNLSASFQRMSQEPVSKRQNYTEYYRLMVLNHTFLTAAAALGSFIQNRTTTSKSAHFQSFIDAIVTNLDLSIDYAERADGQQSGENPGLSTAVSYLDDQYSQLAGELGTTQPSNKDLRLQELTLVSNQLKWLLNLSENIRGDFSKLPAA